MLNRIIRKTTLNRHDHVIEIGPGKGHITNILVKKCRAVSAIEIDGRLYNNLTTKFKDTRNIRLYHQDFLKWPLPKSGDYKVFSNIPFCFTTAIIRKLTESKNSPTETWLTMEKGAAKRFMGKPSESLRSLLLKPLFDMEIIYYFQREDFHPKPGVDVVLFHLKKKKSTGYNFEPIEKLISILSLEDLNKGSALYFQEINYPKLSAPQASKTILRRQKSCISNGFAFFDVTGSIY